jgi:hypothetical protein
LQNHVNDLACFALLDDVRLDDAARAVVESSSWSEIPREELTLFVLVVRGSAAAMHSVSKAVSAKN